MGILQLTSRLIGSSDIAWGNGAFSWVDENGVSHTASEVNATQIPSSIGWTVDAAIVALLYGNVKRYGAEGDGVTNDTAAILATIQAVASLGNAIFFPPGTYLCNKVTLTDGLGIYGFGAILKLADNTNDSLLYGSTLAGIHIHNIKLNGNKAMNSECSAIWLDGCTNPCLIDVEVFDAPGFAVSTNGAGVTFNNCVNPKAVNLSVYDSGKEGCYVMGAAGTGGVFANCDFYDNEYSGIGVLQHSNLVLIRPRAWGNGKLGSSASQITLNGLNSHVYGGSAVDGGAGSTSGFNIGHDLVIGDASGSKLVGCYSYNNPIFGFLIGGGATQSHSDVEMVDCHAKNNGQDNFKLTGAPRFKLVRPLSDAANYLASGTHAGIQIETGSVDGLIDSPTCINGVSTGAAVCYGIWMKSGANRNAIKAPTFSGNTDSDIVDAGSGNAFDGELVNDVSIVSADSADDTLQSYTLTASLVQTKGSLRILASGNKSGAGGNKTIYLKFDGTAIAQIGPVNDTTHWRIEAELISVNAASQRWQVKTYNNGTILAEQESLTTKNTAGDLVISTTATVAVAGDNVTQRVWKIEQIGNKWTRA